MFYENIYGNALFLSFDRVFFMAKKSPAIMMTSDYMFLILFRLELQCVKSIVRNFLQL